MFVFEFTNAIIGCISIIITISRGGGLADAPDSKSGGAQTP